MIYIFAGDFKQAQWLATNLEKNIKEWRYIDRPEQVRGIMNPNILLFGTYYQKVEMHKFLLEYAASRLVSLLDVSDSTMRIIHEHR